ncbi:MAG: quinolinate synthase NadA [Candidatus Thorarchaeota archaeon]
MNKQRSSIKKRILTLKEQRNALILAHNYQPLEVQKIADRVGDSLQLARIASDVNGHDMVIFAGVRFMAEMASVLANDTPVYIPDPDATCPLASFCGAERVREAKEQHPDAPVVVYVNTTAETKSECDVICTSSNAVDIVESLQTPIVLFGPDVNLARYARTQTHTEIIDIAPEGHCYVHQEFNVEDIQRLREEYPEATVLVHPECPPDVQDIADIVGSTGKMAEYVSQSDDKAFIIATEVGLVEQLRDDYPNKVIVAANEKAICKDMKKTSLEKILHILEERPEENLVTVPVDMRDKVRLVLERMNRVGLEDSPISLLQHLTH